MDNNHFPSVHSRRLARPLQHSDEFIEGALSLPVKDVLIRAKRIRRIANTAARMSGEAIKREGDYNAQRFIRGAYLASQVAVNALIRQSMPYDDVADLLTTVQSHETLLKISSVATDEGLATAASSIGSDYEHLILSEDGIRLNHGLPDSLKGYGCPFAKGNPNRAKQFIALSDRAIETYVSAHKLGMPNGWMDYIRLAPKQR